MKKGVVYQCQDLLAIPSDHLYRPSEPIEMHTAKQNDHSFYINYLLRICDIKWQRSGSVSKGSGKIGPGVRRNVPMPQLVVGSAHASPPPQC